MAPLRRPSLRARSPGRGGPLPLALAVYTTLAVATIGIALARDVSPVGTDPWVALPGGLRYAVSLGGGLALAAGTVAATRALVRRWRWARALHADLRPAVRHASGGTLLLLGSASAVAEELFFRGLLAPEIGLVLSSVVFGALHRRSGPAGRVWAVWAGLMGLLFGALFFATGSLLGPIVAHAAINVVNLRFLRDTDLEPRKPRRLGGLLGPI